MKQKTQAEIEMERIEDDDLELPPCIKRKLGLKEKNFKFNPRKFDS